MHHLRAGAIGIKGIDIPPLRCGLVPATQSPSVSGA